MIVTRGAHAFDVDDDDLSGDWGFWQRFADGRWESEILDRMPDLLADGGTYIDLGAWIGPQLLWASAVGAERCCGIEPDPTAFDVLIRNVAPRPSITVTHAAVATENGTTTIATAGDSMSRTGEGTYEVRAYTVEDYVHRIGATRSASLVKIDIEGAEQDVFPQASDFLRSLDCPVFLSIHPWIVRDPFRGTSGWKVEQIAQHEVLLWPV